LTWTPDGRSIVFGSIRRGVMNLWRISPSGGEPEPLGISGDNGFFPAFARQGERIVFNTSSQASSMWRVDLPVAVGNPAPAHKLFSAIASDAGMQISPDASRIAFTSDRSGTSEVWICDSDGLNPLRLTNLGHAAGGSPSWSPDGRLIAFDGRLEGKSDIYLISADGGQPRRLTEDAAIPSWSRDGRWIYFVSDRSGNFQLWKIHAEGGDAVRVTRDGGSPAFESQDGKYVYYKKGLPGFGQAVPGLWRMSVEGGEEELVFDRFPKEIWWAGWGLANDGVYFMERATPDWVIKFYSFATRRVMQIATSPLICSVAVSPNGRWLLYAQQDFQDSNIMLVENFR
jgi:Tol biopolymer transport system component